MDCTELAAFRHALYSCYTRAADALMNACDALLTEVGARSFIELSLSPLFRRGWPSLYQAFRNGVIDRSAQRKLFASAAPILDTPGDPIRLVQNCFVQNGRLLLGIDASSIYRPVSGTSEDRTAQLVHNLAGKAPPVKAGWSFSTLAVLPERTSSWAYVLDCLRIRSDQTPAEVACEQIQAIVPLLTDRLPAGVSTLLVGDRYYGSAAFVRLLHALKEHKAFKDFPGGALGGLFRIQGHRVFYRSAPPPTGRAGHPTWDGPRFKPNDPSTYSIPDASFQGELRRSEDEKERPIQVNAWDRLHFKKCREVSCRIVQVIRLSAAGTKRDPRTSWFISIDDLLKPTYTGSIEPAAAPPIEPNAVLPTPSTDVPPMEPTDVPHLELKDVPPTYGRRFSLEHLFRYIKGPLMWTQPHLHSPDQFQRWTDTLSAVVNQIVLARDLVAETRRDWERNSRPATPEQVRRGLAGIIPNLGTPAQPCQLRGYSPGRPKGNLKKPAIRYPIIKRSDSFRSKTPLRTPKTAPSTPSTDPPGSSKPTSSPWIPPAWLLHALRSRPKFV